MTPRVCDILRHVPALPTAGANDRSIDAEELRFIEKLALEERVIDSEEREALQRIFARVNPEDPEDDVGEEIAVFRANYAIRVLPVLLTNPSRHVLGLATWRTMAVEGNRRTRRIAAGS
jgi:hypothetical protein